MKIVYSLFLFCLLSSATLFGKPAVDCSFLISHLQKNRADFASRFPSLSDIADEGLNIEMPKAQISWRDTKNKRIEAVKDFPLKNVVAAPGHRFLRKPGQVMGLVKYMQEKNGGDFAHDPILLNIVTNRGGTIKEVDLWNAHHRLVAYIKAGYTTIGQLNQANIDILVNGKQEWAEHWPHFLPSAGIDLAKFPTHGVVPVEDDIRPGTVFLSGKLSNYDLGSRNTVGKLAENTFRENTPKIGIYFGTFDPLHENHIKVANAGKELGQLDEVLVVPNVHSVEKENATDATHRIEMAKLRIQKEKGLNLYTADSASLIDPFGRAPFIERVGQIYGTEKLYQIIGRDSFEKLLEQGYVAASVKHHFLIYPRLTGEAQGPILIPEELKDKVTVLNATDDKPLSSTELRRKVREGEAIPTDELDAAILSYVRKHHLYLSE